MEHPIIRWLVKREDHGGGELGTVLFGDLAIELVRIAEESPDGENDPVIGEVLDILYDWIDLENPYLVNEFSSSFLEYLEFREGVGERLLKRLNPKIRSLKAPKDFPWSYPSRQEFEEDYKKKHSN